MRAARLSKELKTLEDSPIPGIAIYPREEAMDVLDVQMVGPPESPYSKGLFKLQVNIPQRYPFEPPSVKFLTKVYHPNIDTQGRICLSSLKMPPAGSWQPSLNVGQVLSQIRLLLDDPNPSDPLMPDISEVFLTDREEFNRTASAYTDRHACMTTQGTQTKSETGKENVSRKENVSEVNSSAPSDKKRKSEEGLAVESPRKKKST